MGTILICLKQKKNELKICFLPYVEYTLCVPTWPTIESSTFSFELNKDGKMNAQSAIYQRNAMRKKEINWKLE